MLCVIFLRVRAKDWGFWLVVSALFFLTRVPAMAQYLTIDNVNLALSLEHFDPRAHQPQPPGYPLFVLFNKAVNTLFHNPATTFKMTGLLASALCLPLVFVLGKRMFDPWVGRAAVMLFLVAPPFWYASLEGPLRPYLALFSLLTAYFCWRCWNGEKSFAVWSAIALAIGSGFRPDLGGFLFPLWFLSAWMGTRSIAAVLRGLIVMAGIVFLWVGGTAYAVGGLQNLYELNRNYILDQSQRRSIVLGAGHESLRQLSRLVVWNATAVLASLWAVPVFLKSKERVSLLSSHSVFIAVWLLPGMLFQGLIHVEDPGHTLLSIPALSIIAAYLIFVGTQRIPELREIFLSAAVAAGALLFLGFFSLPAAAEPAGGLNSLKNAFLFRTFETSIDELRYQDNTARSTLTELQQFTPADRPIVIVTSDAGVKDWFMNWRIARYYLPKADFWVMAELQDPNWVEHVRRDAISGKSSGLNLKIPIPLHGRIIWLLERDGPFHRALKQTLPALPGGAYLSYTDVESGTLPFRVMNFEFVPDISH
jgi:hypothetical protein